jgi:hypothetical protein
LQVTFNDALPALTSTNAIDPHSLLFKSTPAVLFKPPHVTAPPKAPPHTGTLRLTFRIAGPCCTIPGHARSILVSISPLTRPMHSGFRLLSVPAVYRLSDTISATVHRMCGLPLGATSASWNALLHRRVTLNGRDSPRSTSAATDNYSVLSPREYSSPLGNAMPTKSRQ